MSRSGSSGGLRWRPSLAQEVESLLAQQTAAENFIESPALELAAKGIAADSDLSTVVIPGKSPSHSMIGQTIGQRAMGTFICCE
jgi:hypothetical protein